MSHSPSRPCPVATRVGGLARATASGIRRGWWVGGRGLTLASRGLLRCTLLVVGAIPRLVRPAGALAQRVSPGWGAVRGEGRLVADCEAFFGGRYQARLSRRSRWQWGWVNTLAHGGNAEIEALASRRAGRRTGAAVFASGELLRAQEREGWDLAWFQRRFLVPLELDCMRGTEHGAVQAVEGVLDAIRHARSGRPSGSPQEGGPRATPTGGLN
jgi:hypothetical protein